MMQYVIDIHKRVLTFEDSFLKDYLYQRDVNYV